MATTVEQFQALIPEFATVDETLIQTYLDIAAYYVSLDFWGSEKYDYIHALMTAHLMKSAGAGSSSSSASGPITSERLGDISVSYATATTDANSLTSTSYGSLIKQLARSIMKTPMGY